MQRWERPHHRGRPVTTTKPQTSHPPSFSSTLLDAIYRSLDEDRGAGPATEQPHCVTVDAAATRKNATITEDRPSFHLASTTSTASSGGFSSSESDVVALPAPRLPKPVTRTSDPPGRTPKQSSPGGRRKETEGHARWFQASEFYGELRKTKPPVSPGSRLASFLTNLLAAAGKPKKPKTPTAAGGKESGRSPPSSCSRSSCLVTTPSSRAKTPPSCSGGAAKRSLEFYAAGLLVGEEPPPLPEVVIVGQLSSSEAEERKLAGMAAREVVMRRCRERIMGIEEEEEEDEDDGAGSCSSSELFELENLEMGYQLGELPLIARARDFLL